MKKTVKFLPLIAFGLLVSSCGSTPTTPPDQPTPDDEEKITFDSAIDSLSNDNGRIKIKATIDYVNGETADTYVVTEFTSNSKSIKYDELAEELGEEDHGYVKLKEGIASYKYSSTGGLVWNGWVLAGNNVTVDDYSATIASLANVEWSETEDDSFDEYTHSTTDSLPVRLVGSLINTGWIYPNTKQSETLAKVNISDDNEVSLSFSSSFTYTNPIDKKDYDGTFDFTITDIGKVVNHAVEAFLETNPTFSGYTEWPTDLALAMREISGGVIPCYGTSAAINISVEKDATGKVKEWSVEDYGCGDKESTLFAQIEALGYTKSETRGGTVGSGDKTYTVTVFEKLLTDATPTSGKKVMQIQCNFVNPNYLGYKNGSGIMEIYGSIYSYPFDGQSEIVKSSETGVNAYLSELLDNDGKAVFPTLDFGDYTDIYIEDTKAKFSWADPAFSCNLYIPISDDSEVLALRESIFGQLDGYKSRRMEEDYQRYFDDGDTYFVSDSNITIEGDTKDLDGDGVDEKVALLSIFFMYA